MYAICFHDLSKNQDFFEITDDYVKWQEDHENDDIDIIYVFDTVTDILANNESAKNMFEQFAYRYGFSPSDYGKIFYNRSNEPCKLINIKPQNRKYPIIYKNIITNKTYKTRPEYLYPLMNN